MTIKDAAAKYHVSQQAIYKRLKSNGIEVDTLKDKSTGQLTADAELVLEKLFGAESLEKRESINQQNEHLKKECTELHKLVDELKKQTEEQQTRIEELKKDKQTLASALEQAQAVQLALTNRLLPPAEGGQNKSSGSGWRWPWQKGK